MQALFIAGENEEPIVVVLKLYQMVFAVSNGIIVLFVAVVISTEINRRHCFWSDLCLY